MTKELFNKQFKATPQTNDPTAEWWARVEDGGASRVLIDRVNGIHYYENYFGEITKKVIKKA